MQGNELRVRARTCLPLVISAWLLLLLVALLPSIAVAAGSERYEYDGLGRLVRVIDASNKVTDYQYDAAGNITAVIGGSTAVAPTLTAVSPESVRRSATTRVTLTGTELTNAALSTSDPELTVAQLTRTATTISFDLVVSASATLGAATLRITSAAGNAQTEITIRPALPVAQVAPLPIAVTPGGPAGTYELALSHADDVAHSFALTMTRSDIATVNPANLTIPVGQLKTTFSVRGLVGGNTELRMDSPTLGIVQVPVFVAAEIEGLHTARAINVGVDFERLPVDPTGFPGDLAAPLVGVIFGNKVWIDTQPRFVAQGSTQTLRVVGVGLLNDLAVAVDPAAGLTLGAPEVAADGSQATVTVSADASAATGLRTLKVTAGGVPLSPATVQADAIDVVVPEPVVTSVAPLFVDHGATVKAFEIRGRNLQDVTHVEFRGAGVTAGSTLTASPDGTLLSVGLQVANFTAPGPRFVVVHAPGGSSAEVASVANTFEITDGVSTPQPYPNIAAPAVGIAFGPILTGLSPTSIAWGETKTLTLNGEYLQGVDNVAFDPATGLTVGPVSVAPDGRSLSVSVSADTPAPAGPRRVVVRADATELHFATASPPTLTVTEVIVDEPTPVTYSDLAAPAVGVQFGELEPPRPLTFASPLVGVHVGDQDPPRPVTFASPLVGVELSDAAEPVPLIFASPLVGVQLADVADTTADRIVVAVPVGLELALTPQPEVTRSGASMPTGVLFGAGVASIEPPFLIKGQAVELVVHGNAIPADGTLQFTPSGPIAPQGAATVSADGSMLRQTVVIAADAPLQFYDLRVLNSLGAAIPAASPQARQIQVLYGPPEVISLDPILARQGERPSVLIRGRGLGAATRVIAEPSAGVDISSSFTVNAAGTELTVPALVRDGAQLGARVIRVFTRAGESATAASPANTFTVFPKE